MCDSGDYEHISDYWVMTRKAHECGSCLSDFHAGTRMRIHVGKSEGEFFRTYGCSACEFALKQEDETILHLCWGWNWGDYSDYDEIGDAGERWKYINDTLANGETPTVEGVKSHLASLTAQEDL